MAGDGHRRHLRLMLSVFVWVMVGLAVWHFAVLVPDRFFGGIMGACAAAVFGAMVAGYLLPVPGVNAGNPPGLAEAVWPVLGAAVLLATSYWYGGRLEDRGTSRVERPEGAAHSGT